MFARLRFLVRYYLFWTGFLLAARVVFLAWEHARTARLPPAMLGAVLLHGLRMDLSAAAYATVLPALLAAVSAAGPARVVRATLHAYTVTLIAVVSLLVAADLGVYDAWGYRLDASPFAYLAFPHEAFASAASSPLARLAVVAVLLAVGGVLAWRRLVRAPLEEMDARAYAAAPVMLVLGALLLVPIRGGVQNTPLNESSVYFSDDDFANQATLNVPWNVVHSLNTDQALVRTNPYRQIAPAVAQRLVDSLFRAPRAPTARLLRIRRPNVVLLIWESLTAKVVERLGGVPGVTPVLDSLTHQGVLFDHIYASGDRSPKGLVAILSGFPTQPRVQLLNTPQKAAALPMLARDLGNARYDAAFYYGGDLAFANIKSYLIAGRYASLVGEREFPDSLPRQQWGVSDQYVLRRLLADVPAMPRPFFATLFTLSSHEPFDVPGAPRAPGEDETAAFLRSHAYTDRAVGAFVRAARTQPWWDSTLVIIIADHGQRMPPVSSRDGEEASLDYHIPMLWLGGALAVRDTVITTIGSQTDLAPTLLAQLGLPHAAYRWGRDLLAPGARSFAYFSYIDGFGYVDDAGRLVYDPVSGKVTERAGRAGRAELRAGLAILRQSYQSYIDK